jgi:DNA-binding NtrC family response regulator
VLVQARLARALGDERARRKVYTDARILASTEVDLAQRVQDGTFSRELLDVLSVITVKIPPLRERRDDVPLLVRHFLHRFAEELNRPIKGVEDTVLKRLVEHAWPGNVGELQSVLKRACIVARGQVIAADEVGNLDTHRPRPRHETESDLARAVRMALQERLVDPLRPPSSSTFHEIVDAVETTLVKEALSITTGNQVKAADLLGVNRATLRKKMSG